jgi:hypothetical protein
MCCFISILVVEWWLFSGFFLLINLLSCHLLFAIDRNRWDYDLQGEPLSLWFRKLTFALVKSKEICFVRNLLRLYRMGNYKNFLSRTASEATYLQYCISEHHIREMRLVAVQYINNVCYKLQPYPLLRLSQNLKMKVIIPLWLNISLSFFSIFVLLVNLKCHKSSLYISGVGCWIFMPWVWSWDMYWSWWVHCFTREAVNLS